jgi:hypothetical protein
MNIRSRSYKNLRNKRVKDASGSIMLTKATLAQKDMPLTAGNCEGKMFTSPPKEWHVSIFLE